jgi:hypothetical protein
LDFVIDQVAQTYAPIAEPVGVGGRVIAHLAETLSVGSHLYCDRYLTNLPLIDYMLKEKGIHITGTIMKNRILRKVLELSNNQALARMGRGSLDMIVRQDRKAAIINWYDKKPILLVSSAYAADPIDKCRRWSKKDRQYIQVDRPLVVREYNAKMGGVDLCDRMISYYRIKARTRKWPVRTLFHFIDLSLVNSWIQYREEKKAAGIPSRNILQFMNFRVDIAESLLSAADDSISSSDEETAGPSQKRKFTQRPFDHKRLAGAKHLPEFDTRKCQMRCKQTGCQSKTLVMCGTCKVHLCISSSRTASKRFTQLS